MKFVVVFACCLLVLVVSCNSLQRIYRKGHQLPPKTARKQLLGKNLARKQFEYANLLLKLQEIPSTEECHCDSQGCYPGGPPKVTPLPPNESNEQTTKVPHCELYGICDSTEPAPPCGDENDGINNIYAYIKTLARKAGGGAAQLARRVNKPPHKSVGSKKDIFSPPNNVPTKNNTIISSSLYVH